MFGFNKQDKSVSDLVSQFTYQFQEISDREEAKIEDLKAQKLELERKEKAAVGEYTAANKVIGGFTKLMEG